MPTPLSTAPTPEELVTGSDVWNERHRAESPLCRADRNFVELLQELRVTLTGVQILLGFLLTASFTERFARLDPVQLAMFVTTLIAAAVSSALLVAPVAARRVVFRRGCKPELVRWAHRLTQLGLGALAVTLVAGLALVLDLAVGRVGALAGGAGFVTMLVLLRLVGPVVVRATSRG